MNIVSPFSSPSFDPSQWLTEQGFSPFFSRLQVLYYRFARPMLPVFLRQALQRQAWRRVVCRSDFIDPTMVDKVFDTTEGQHIAQSLYPDDHTWAVVLTHDVETMQGLSGIPRIMDIEEKHGFRSSWNVVPYGYEIDQGILKEIRARNHEIGIHGFNHDGRLYWSEKIFRERALKINEALKRFGAVGFRSPMVHRNLEWLQALDIEYDASCFDYDVYQPFPGGVKSIWPYLAGRFVELPYTLPQDHTLFVVLSQKNAALWERKARWLIRHHGVVLLLTHPDYLNTPERRAVYSDFLAFLKDQPGGWHVLPRELASWWRGKYARDDHGI